MSLNNYNNYAKAFDDMLNATSLNEPFKLSHRRIDGTIKVVHKALLRKQTDSRIDSMGSYKINYIDVTNNEMGTCYIPLILSINNKQIIL